MKMQKKTLVVSPNGAVSGASFTRLAPLKLLQQRTIPTGEIAIFLLKVGALEAVRRLSKAKCPIIWKALQTFQLLYYPPFKWLHRWRPLKIMVDCFQNISKPLLFLSITTAFSDNSQQKNLPDSVHEPQPNSELSRRSSASDLSRSDESINDESENMMLQLNEELNKLNITLPKRFNKDELQRFYEAANGDFQCFISSVKKTIRWRETYHIFSLQELEPFSHLVFWHGFDVMLRPCLVIRLGLAISSLLPHDRPRFSQAVDPCFASFFDFENLEKLHSMATVSQIEHGIVHLLNDEDPRITVVMDCEGISPLRFPMNMMRSCCCTVQVHYPNRLASLFVIRLPSVVRVLAQTLIQVLKPATRQKLRIEGESYQKILSEFLRTVPAFLGGRCTCLHCERFSACKSSRLGGSSSERQNGDYFDDDSADLDYPIQELDQSSEYNHVLRSAILVFLMLWIVIAFLAGMLDFA